MKQIELFKKIPAWKQQKLNWWDMHDFRPEVGMIVMVDEVPWHFLQADVLAVDQEEEIIKVQIRKYPDCPWIRTEVLELNYFKVDPVLTVIKTEDP